jgi:hypothetical protein
MLEMLEQLSPPIQQMLEDPKIAAAGLGAGSIATYAFIAQAGALKADYEISDMENQEISERRKELTKKIETDTIYSEVYNMFRHPWTDGKLSAYQQADENHFTYIPKIEDPEYFNQIYTDERLEELE